MPRLGRFVPLVLIALVVLAAPQLVRYYTDWLWFGEVGFRQVFGTILRTQSLLFLAGFVGSVIWFAINVRIAVATMGDRRPTFVTREGFEVQLPGREQIQRLALAAMTVVAGLIGLYAASQWNTWLRVPPRGAVRAERPGARLRRPLLRVLDALLAAAPGRGSGAGGARRRWWLAGSISCPAASPRASGRGCR